MSKRQGPTSHPARTPQQEPHSPVTGTPDDSRNVSVLSLAELRAGMLWKTQQRLLDYWNDIRGDKKMPSRQDFDPASIPKLLTRIGLIDVVLPGPRFRYRIVGSEMARSVPQKLEGSFVDALEQADYAAHLTRNFNLLCTMQRPVYIIEHTQYQTDYIETVSRLLLPLSRTPPDVDMILYSTMHARNADAPVSDQPWKVPLEIGRTILSADVSAGRRPL